MPLLKVGLTGGIASGKSLASQYFSQSGVNIIDADKISKQLLSADSPLLKPIKLRFGENILDVYGQLKRDVLRQIVFNSKEDLDWLNQLIHPKVAETIEQKLSHYNKKADKGYIIIDIPLLINQTGNIPEHLSRFIDRILVIDTDVDNQINRI
ncbi:MAG: dephospho-CoA kinase, partial [Gammaproteobacteria bacterium]|nr:dephospho-CoA kinase [Gammaproteobacteria bacterium]